MEDLDIIKEFLIESDENLARLDQEIIDLEKDPANPGLIASIFRTIHTIKGTCGFLGFSILTEVSHSAENILSQVRDGKRVATPKLINIILEAIDVIKQILKGIEATGKEGADRHSTLVAKLQAFVDSEDPVDTSSPGVVPEVRVEADYTESRLPEATVIEPLQSAVSKELVLPEVDQIRPAAAAMKTDKPAVVDTSIRVGVDLLDKLMNLVGELVLARNQILQFSSRLEDNGFNATSQRLNLITSELQESVMKTRMQPIGIIWGKFPRVVRDIATSIGKQITLTMDGTETELDRTIIEAIKDPLTHIVRNSCDHGIEKPEQRTATGKPQVGRISMRAFHDGGHVVIEISDDGAGLNPEKIKAKAVQKGLITPEQASRMGEREAINTIFLPGFSTAEQVSNISGRGVGMDVVKTNIERIGGVVDLLSTFGQGTTIRIKIPLTLAIIPGLVVASGGERFVIPQVSLSELVRLEGQQQSRQIETIHNVKVYRRRGKLLQLIYLREVLREGERAACPDVINVVILQVEGREFGLVVDEIKDTQEIVVKPLNKHLKSLTVYSGATIMGDGKIALILDVQGIAHLAGIGGEPSRTIDRNPNLEEAAADDIETLLLFSAGRFDRVAVPLSQVARLEEILPSQVERAAGELVTQYRGHILPLTPLVGFLDAGACYQSPIDEKLQVVVFNREDGSSVGIIVDRIIDIVQERISVRRASTASGLLGSAVIGKHVTDLLDISAIVRSTEDILESESRDLRSLSESMQSFETQMLESALT